MKFFEFATTTEDNHLALSVSRNHFTFLSDILVSEELGGNLKIQAAKMLQYLVQASPAISVLRMCLEHPIMEYLLVLGKQRNPEPHELCEAPKLCGYPDNLAVLLGEALLKLFANSSSQPQQLSTRSWSPPLRLDELCRAEHPDWTALQARFPKSKDQIAGLIAKLNAAKSSKRAATTTNT
ncbi:hypothetical protein BV898_18660 [Hypsibius exemplaris]|uniref:Uncharacterized protein n=1 Tax=Hypsibius exemplaris TaxID=2072580 RepID=A0A9X6NQI8_HYPEX|nr:hypothetical protein BV898_18660 [Hypsibius exemplaris]